MSKLRGRRLTWIASTIAVAVVFGAVISLRTPILEYWHIRRLQSGDEEVRGSAMKWLEANESVRAIPPLLATVSRPGEPLLPLATPGGKLVARLVEAQPGRSVGPLCVALRHDDPWVRFMAVTHLSSLGQQAAPAVGPLLDMLEDPERRVRWNAVWALGDIGLPAVAATRRLKDSHPDPKVRALAEQAFVLADLQSSQLVR